VIEAPGYALNSTSATEGSVLAFVYEFVYFKNVVSDSVVGPAHEHLASLYEVSSAAQAVPATASVA